MSQNVIDVLHHCRLFSEVPERAFQRLVTIARICKFPKGQMIFREGQPCPGTYVVGSGLVRVFKAGTGGKEHVLHIVGPGHTFAEVAAIGGFACPANAEAIAPTTCVLLPTDLFRTALEEDHDLCLGLLTGMTVWVRHLVGVMEGVVLRDATGRLAQYLLDLDPDERETIELPGLKRHIASHLNLTSETFSRILRRLVDAGLIAELENNRVRLLDRGRLSMAAKGLAPQI
jgi:CRP/FNR family transcriptional regulator